MTSTSEEGVSSSWPVSTLSPQPPSLGSLPSSLPLPRDSRSRRGRSAPFRRRPSSICAADLSLEDEENSSIGSQSPTVMEERDALSLVDPVEIDVGVATAAVSSGGRPISAPTYDPAEEQLSTSLTDEGYCSPVNRVHHEQKKLLVRTMTEQEEQRKKVYKVVLTGGPCGGKTTGQERLATFFENMGWKVYTVPETATVLLGGGVKFAELSEEQQYQFQKDLLLTLIRIEDVFFNQAALEQRRRVLIICDRGAMDPSAYITADLWKRMLDEIGLEQFNLREIRYDQVVHMVTAAAGAQRFYTLANNNTRKEGIEQAVEQDRITRTAWLGHPYVDVIDNEDCRNFDDKILKLIQVVCDRAGVEVRDRLAKNSRKRKWLVTSFDVERFPKFEQFDVKHDYLITDKRSVQVRLRTRCQDNRTTYTLTTRSVQDGEVLETRMQLNLKDYQGYYRMKDKSRATLHKQRRCFTYGTQYFHLDTYVDPLPPGCRVKKLMILETYTTKQIGDPDPELPDFLFIEKEITGNPAYSMYELSKVEVKHPHDNNNCGSNGVPKIKNTNGLLSED